MTQHDLTQHDLVREAPSPPPLPEQSRKATRALLTFWRFCHALLSPALTEEEGNFASREQSRRGGLLGTILAANLAPTGLVVLAHLSRPSDESAALGIFFLVQLICARLNHTRRPLAASWLLLAAMMGHALFLVAAKPEELPIPGIVNGSVTIVLAGFLISRRAPYAFAACVTAIFLVCLGRHVHPMTLGYADRPLLEMAAPVSITLILLAVITSLGAGSLEDALIRADEADMLERRVTERTADLAESREQLHFALKGADLGAWSHEIGTGKVIISEEGCRLLGLPPGRKTERLEEMLAMVHPEDQPALQEKALAAERAGAGYQHELRIVQRDGSARWLAMMGRFTCDEQTRRALRVDGAVMDITERKTLEAERERLLAEAIERADRDALTGLLNHRAFHRRLDEEADRALRSGQPLCVGMMDLDNFKFFNDAYGHLAGDDVMRQVAAALRGACRTYDTLARFGGDEFALLLPGVGVEEAARILDRAQEALDRLGYRPPGHDVTIPLSLSVGLAVFPNDGPTRLDVLERADERLYRAKTGADDKAEADRLRVSLTQRMDGFSMLDALVTAVDNKDRYTRRHSEDVQDYSLQIARALGLDAATQHTVAVAALLHDVGKIGVPDRILRKPDRLTEEELEAVRQHPMMGAIIVGAIFGFEETLEAIRHHHERWDGQGYPFGLRGEECPLIARLMAVADAFSAMTTDRPYRKGMAEDHALAILRAGAGTQWDPACVSAFLSARRPSAPASPAVSRYRVK